MSGANVVVGAPYESVGSYSDAGNAYLFSDSTGNLIATLTSPNAQSEGGFGFSTALSDKLVIVGAYAETVNGISQGNAYEFNTKGSLVQKFVTPNGQSYGEFGFSVSASTGIVAVGGPCEAYPGKDSCSGVTHVFFLNYGVIASPNAQSGGGFGYSVSASGTLVAVGAPGEDSNYGNVYLVDGADGVPVHTLTTQYGGFFGNSVSMSGTLVAVGTPYADVGGDIDAGAVFMFNATTGDLLQTLISPNYQDGGQFGWSVSLSGSLLAVGAYGETSHGYSEAGNAYTFNATTGDPIQSFTSPNYQLEGSFGWAVSVSGKLVTIGAAFESTEGDADAGNAYVFNAVTGLEVYHFASLNPQEGGFFGWSVSMSGKLVTIGAYSEAVSGNPYAGDAYVFDTTTGDCIQTLTTPHP